MPRRDQKLLGGSVGFTFLDAFLYISCTQILGSDINSGSGCNINPQRSPSYKLMKFRVFRNIKLINCLI